MLQPHLLRTYLLTRIPTYATYINIHGRMHTHTHTHRPLHLNAYTQTHAYTDTHTNTCENPYAYTPWSTPKIYPIVPIWSLSLHHFI